MEARPCCYLSLVSSLDPQTAAVAIHVNGEAREVAANATVSDLLQTLELRSRKVAVAIDREVVPRSSYAQTVLHDGARVEILEAVGGG